MLIKETGFKGNLLIRKAGIPPVGGFTPDRQKEFIKCATDPLYFCRKYVKIKHIDFERKILFKPRGYQLKMLESILKNRNTISRWPRQSGKTTVLAAVALHYLIFTRNYSILIAAHKGDKAQEIVSALQDMFMELPSWLQQGVTEWNKRSFKLENGSRVKCSTTSTSSARGDTYNMIMLDEFAFVAAHVAEEFVKSVIPTVSSGKDSKIIITSTPRGLNYFYKIWAEATKVVEAERKPNDFVPIAVEWNEVPGRDEAFKESMIKQHGKNFWEQEFACAFIGSSQTLIDSSKLLVMVAMDPIKETEETRVYAEPQPHHVYAMTVDVAEGLGGDFSVAMVFDVTASPYRVVYIYQDRYIDTMALPGLIFEIGRRYNNAMVLVESNFGQMVADILWRDFQYEHVIFTERAVKIPGGFKVGWGSKRQVPGVQMNKTAKHIGCTTLKSLIENDQLIIDDDKTIEELRRFAVKKKSYAAETGNDDLAMALVLFGWLSEQGYVKHQTDVNVRASIANLNKQRIDNQMLVAYRNDGIPPDTGPVAASSANDDWLLKENDPEPDSIYLDDLDRWERHGW